MLRSIAAAAVVSLAVVCGCASAGDSAVSADAKGLVLYTRDVPRGYQYGDDSGCGTPSATEGDWPRLRPLFANERPNACSMQLEWVWRGKPPYPRTITSAAYAFRDNSGARSAFAAREELASFTASLSVKGRTDLELGDEAELLRGSGLNSAASGVVWRHADTIAVLVVEPANNRAARVLAQKQQARLERPSIPPPQARRNDPALQLDDPSLKLPVYWFGRRLDPAGSLPPLELELANVGGGGPGQSIQLWYRGGITLDIWRPTAWRRFRRTRLGRLIWDSPCARRRVVAVRGGRAEIFHGYGAPKPLGRPCPRGPRDRVIAHVYYGKVVVAVNMPYCYACAGVGRPGPYNTVSGIETAVRALRIRRAG